MQTLSGLYHSLSGRILTVNDHNRLALLPRKAQQNETDKLRVDGDFWLCRNDGLVGKFGTPEKVTLHCDGQEYNIWVETRGFRDGSTEYGLSPIPPGGEYSNRFLAVNEELDRLEIVGQWDDQAKFRYVS
ncbi:uncharacterized protein KD926_005035 [Aspergillus affinis]|uniref:uncharacterized protein n=1 Tax=Aspergillus affinis TaxID=1070780 RepID=UPI0022FE8F01|nr:uncharacterized protein KD926_005035 [Aspergillus affinis]KAI9034903.1 hypothetical protein KD926_005035 [Aspergillus affinis]